MDRLADTRNLGHGITRVDSGYMQGHVAAIYLMQQQGKCAIIETGTVHSVPRILALLESWGLTTDNVRYIIPTHVHLDHAGGVGELMHQCKKARLVVHPYGARHLIDPSRLEAGAKAVYGEHKFKKLYGTLRPVHADRIIETQFDSASGEQHTFKLDFDGRVLEFIDTPGHARHHFCVYDRQSQGIFTGDTFGLAYPQLATPGGPFIFATTTPVQFDPNALLDSIDTLVSYHSEYMYLTHFGAIQPTPALITQLKQSVQAFVGIARESAHINENRIRVIQQKIMYYLLDELEKADCPQSRRVCESIIEMDTLLNAQGLDIWLSRAAA